MEENYISKEAVVREMVEGETYKCRKMEVKVTVEVGSCKYNELAGMEMVEVVIHI